MNSSEAMTWDEYTQQKLNSEFGDYLLSSWGGQLSESVIKSHLEILGQQIGEFACKQGYKPSDKAEIIIKVPSRGASADPLNPFMSVGGKADCELTATKDQYVMYASEIIDELKGECRKQIEKTWGDRLIEHLDSKFKEKHPYIDELFDAEDLDMKREFESKRDELMDKINVMVQEVL